MAVKHYRDLEVWQLAMDLAQECYRVTKAFPREELFGMTSQIRRAAALIPANNDGPDRPDDVGASAFPGKAHLSAPPVTRHPSPATHHPPPYLSTPNPEP